jgi:periplasmic divalent cation tolerance protein
VRIVQLTVSVPTEEAGAAIAGALLDPRLAACVQVLGPMTSRYWWEGEREESTEWLLLAKTREDLVDRAVEALVAAHPYDVPEVLATPVSGGNPDYLRWVAGETTAG